MDRYAERFRRLRPRLAAAILLSAVLFSQAGVLSGGAVVLAQGAGDSTDTPIDVGVPSTTGGELTAPGDRDFYRFPDTTGEALTIRVVLGSLVDSTLEILDTDGRTSLAFNDDSGSLASALRFVPPASGDFFAVVAGFADAAGTYDLVIEEAGEIALADGPRFVGSSFTVFGDSGGDGLGASAAGDFDGDGITDLAIGAPGALLGDGQVLILPGPIDGDATTVTTLSGAGGSAIPGEAFSRTGTALAAADLTGDGVDDLAFASDFGISIVEGGVGLFDFAGFPIPVALDGADFFAILQLVAGDFNADGRPDLAYSVDELDGPVVRFLFGPFDLGEFDAFPAARGQIVPPAGDFSFGQLLTAGDLTSDGRDDLAVRHAVLDDDGFEIGPRISVLAGPFTTDPVAFEVFDTPPFIDFEAALPNGLAIGDADLDGENDLLIADPGFITTIPSRVIQEGRFPFRAVFASGEDTVEGTLDFPYFPAGGFAIAIAIADVDDDGLPDVLLGDPLDTSPGGGSVSLFPGHLRPAHLDGVLPGVVPAGDGASVSIKGRALRGAEVTLVPPRNQPLLISDVTVESNGSLRIAIPSHFGPGVYGVRITTAEGEIELEDAFRLSEPTREITVAPGWDVAAWTGATPIGEALAGFQRDVDRILAWDPVGDFFNTYLPGLPPVVSTLRDIFFGDGLWLHTPEGGSWQQPLVSGSNSVHLYEGFNLVMWRGPAVGVAEAAASLGGTLNAAFHWQAASESFRVYRMTLTEALRDNFSLEFGDVLWIDAAAETDWDQPLPTVAMAPQPPLARSAADVEDATVFISNEVASGSGFVISGTEILTNMHVVGGFRSVLMRFSDDTIVRGYVTAVDAARDVAVVRLARIPDSVRRIDWQTAPAPRRADEIFAWGFPGGELFGEETSVTVSRGIISTIRTEVDVGGLEEFSNLQFDGFTAPGSSGGPIVRDDGRLVGITDFGITTENFTLGFGIDVFAHRDRIWRLLQHVD